MATSFSLVSLSSDIFLGEFMMCHCEVKGIPFGVGVVFRVSLATASDKNSVVREPLAEAGEQ